MSSQDDIIPLLEGKIGSVIQVAEGLIADNEKLRRQVDELTWLICEKDLEVEALESKYQNLKLTKTLASSQGDVKDVKSQLNRMVREIDKCIALLNK